MSQSQSQSWKRPLTSRDRYSLMLSRMILRVALSALVLAQVAASETIADHPYRAELAALAAKFDQMDTSGDGSISRPELVHASETVGHFESEECEDHADSYLNIYDADQDGHVSMDEFVHAVHHFERPGKDGIKTVEQRADQLAKARSVFRAIDHDKDGDISREELLKDMHGQMDPASYPDDNMHELHLREKDDDADSWFDTYDVDRDGKVTIHEIIHKDEMERKAQEADADEAEKRKREADHFHRH